MSRQVRCIIMLTIAAWLALLIDALTPGTDLNVPAARLLICVASVGSIVYAGSRMTQPALELYMAGKMVGRREALAEVESGVPRITQRERRLRAVGDD